MYTVPADCGLGSIKVEHSATAITITVTAGRSFLGHGHLLTNHSGLVDVALGLPLGDPQHLGSAPKDSRV